jgi:hypothetical protein
MLYREGVINGNNLLNINYMIKAVYNATAPSSRS